MPCAVLIFSKIEDEHNHDMKKISLTAQKILYFIIREKNKNKM